MNKHWGEMARKYRILRDCFYGGFGGRKLAVVCGLRADYLDDRFELRLANGVVISGKLSEIEVKRLDGEEGVAA